MITDAILGMFGWVLHTILGVLPVVTVPAWLDTSGPIGTIMADAQSMGVWLPTTLLVTVLAGMLAAWLVGFVIKIVRIIGSFLTVGGGSAG